MVESVKKLKDRKINCNLVIIGEDVDGNEIPDLVENYELKDQVWFYGPCYDEEQIGNLLYNSNVCITPGFIGLTAIHALTYGVPVITSNDFANHGPEFEAIKPDVTGDFFEKDNIKDLLLKIKKWVELDPLKRDEVRKAAYKIIDEKYNPSNQVSIIEKLTQRS